MNETQAQLLSMYKDLSKVLDSHNIKFFLHYGTAIGTIRHNGFIPWDDDIDVIIWEKDLKKVNDILSAELDPKRYYYHIPSADTHPHVIFRTENFEDDLKNKKAPFIDIFVMEKYPNTKGRQLLVNFCIVGSVGTLIVLDHIKSLGIHKVLSRIPRWFERRAKNLSRKDTDLCTVYSTTYKDDIFPVSYFEDTFLHKFEDIEVPLPVGIDKALASLFGDYMTPPPEDQRHGANGYPCSAYKDYCWDLQRKNNKKP